MVVAVAFASAACTSDDQFASSPSTTAGANATPTTQKPALDDGVCRPPTDTTPVDVTPVDEVTELDMVSFDGTTIRLHWLPHPDATSADPHPTILMGPGWSLGGATKIDDLQILGSTSTRSLRDAGYNILTWDPRGFGLSDGTATIDSADFEGRDVQQIIDWLATVPGVQLDGQRDPRIGMIGGSYGGGIALVAAAIDCRVDAVVATAAWNSLDTSLYRSETVKLGWAEVLMSASFGDSLDEHVGSVVDDAFESGVLSDEDRRWFAERGPGDMISDIRVPVLLIQGTIDTLFTLDEAIENYKLLAANEIRVAMLWNCDGHGLCLTDPGDKARAADATLDWLQRWVRDDRTVYLGPAFDTIDQNGTRWIADSYLGTVDRELSTHGRGVLELTDTGDWYEITDEDARGQLLDTLARDITPTRSFDALEVTLTADESAMLLGAPVVDLSYVAKPLTGAERAEFDARMGTAFGSTEGRPARVFAQLVDEQTGVVIGNQSTPIPLVIDGEAHKISLPLESISFWLEEGSRVTLQLTPRSASYAIPLLGPRVEFSSVDLRLPVVDWLQRAPVASGTD